MTYTIILRHDGIDRHYPCASYFDAVVLFDALSKTYPHVEMWAGSVLKAIHAPSVVA